jgi:ankyrin repeat protein
VAAGANVNAADEHKSTALHWACANRHLDVIQVLVDAKANLNAADQVSHASVCNLPYCAA